MSSEHSFTGIPLSTRPAHLHTAIDTAGHPPINVPMMGIVYFGTLAASLERNDQGSVFPSSVKVDNASRAVPHIYM